MKNNDIKKIKKKLNTKTENKIQTNKRNTKKNKETIITKINKIARENEKRQQRQIKHVKHEDKTDKGNAEESKSRRHKPRFEIHGEIKPFKLRFPDAL